MRVALITVYSHPGCTLKDVAGGFGTVFEVGRSWRARLLERAKGRLADLPPLVLGYLSAQLRAAGHEVSVIELRPGDPIEAPVDVAVVLTSLVDRDAERSTLEALGALGIRTVAIGAYASAAPDHFRDAADLVVVGEAESLGARLVDPSLSGVLHAGDVDDLDTLPFPDWAPFPVERYRYAFLSRGPTLPVGSARGCAYGCGYCPWRVTSRFRQRAPERVAAEIRQLVDRHGVRAIAFRDPLFNLDADRVRALAAALAPLGIRFSAEMRADRLDAELLSELARAGLRSLEIGVESVDRTMLSREHRKPPEAAQVEAVVEQAQRLGVRVICNYMLGLPNDDEARIRATVAWAKALDSFAVQFTIATPYPGTSLETEVNERRLPMIDRQMTGFRPTFRHPSLSPERLEALREWAYVSYHFRPAYIRRFLRHAGPALLD